MTVRELIKQLQELDADDMEVRYFVDGFPPSEVDRISIEEGWLEGEDAFVHLI